MTPTPFCPLGATLGEGPIWIDGALWCVDIKERRIHRIDNGGTARSWDAPDQPGWILPATSGRLIVGLAKGVFAFDPVGGGFTEISGVERDRPSNRINDACVDAAGRFWFGTMDDAEAASSGAIYRCDADGCTRMIDGICITNGPAVSPDGGTLYHVDTLGRTIFASRLSGDGSLSAPRGFATVARGYPDGPVVDAESHVWIGLFGGWGVQRYAPDGTLVATIDFPVANVTKIAFGSGTTAYATTARKGLDCAARGAQPLAGDVFSFDAGVHGGPQRTIAHL